MTNELRVRGVPVTWTLVPATRLGALEPWWTQSLSRASRDEVFLGYIQGHALKVPQEAEWARAVVTAAVDCPPRSLPFEYQGKRMRVPLPPSYYQNAVTRADVRIALAAALGRDGGEARVEEAAALPLKLLAASSGLGKYGRNNIVYVEGFGTAHALMAFWTDADPEVAAGMGDAPIDKTPFPGPDCLGRCATCSLCVSLCPTGAIPEELGMIDVNRCIPLWNETERSFPDAVPAGAHNSLIGCVLCQTGCPENNAFTQNIAVLPELSKAETELVLDGAWGEPLRRTLGRILSFDDEKTLEAWAPLIRRNLAAFIASGRTG